MEQGIIFVLLYLITQVELNITENTIVLLTYRSKAYLNMVKSSKVNIRFFDKKMMQKVIKNMNIIITLLFCLGVYSNQVFEYSILLLGAILLLISSVDLFLYHCVLQRSIVYGNKIVRTTITLLINAVVLQYVTYYSVINFYQKNHETEPFWSMLQFGFLTIFIIVIGYCIYRYCKLFQVHTNECNETSSSV